MDLSRLSDDDLRALSVNDLGAMSDAGLKILAAGGAPAGKKGVGAALGKGVESTLGALRTGAEAIFSPEEAAKKGVARQEEIGGKYAEQIGLDKLKEAYEKKGITGAGGELLRQVPLALAEQAPNIATALGGARIGAMGGSAFGPIGTAVGAGLGALTPTALQLFGSNIERQAQEQQAAGQPLDISRGRAAAATAVQAPLDVAATFIPLGGKVMGKLFGPEVEKLLARGGTKAAESLAQESFAKTLGKGLATGAAAEIPTEVLQQVAERAQAGLSLTSPDALKEYGETAYQVGLLAPIGGAGRFVDKSGARAQVEEKKQEDRRVAAEAAKEQQRVEQEQQQAVEFQKAQQETGSLLGETAPEASLLKTAPSTLTVGEREAQAAQTKTTQIEDRARLLKEADTYDKQLLDIEKQRDAAAEKGDFKQFAALDAQARALEESQNKVSAALKELPVELTPDMEMAKLRGEQKNLIKQLQGMTGPSYDAKKAATITAKLEEIDKKISDVTPAAGQMDLFDEAQMGAEERAYKKQQAEARSQEQTDLFEALKPEGKKEVLNKEAIDRYQKGLQDLEDAYAENADERIINRLIDELQRTGQEKEAAGVTSGETIENATLRSERLRKSIAEQKALLEGASQEEASRINTTIGQLTKRLAENETARADNADEIEKQAASKQREALNRAVENVRSILSGAYFNSFYPEESSQLKSGIEQEIRKAGADYTAAALEELNAARRIMGSTQRQGSTERIGGQKALTNDEALQVASEIRKRFDYLAYDPTYLAEKVRDKNLKIFTDELRKVKERFLSGPSKLQAGEFELTSPGEMPKSMRLESIKRQIKEVPAGARTDYVALINNYQSRLDKIAEDTKEGATSMAVPRRVERLNKILKTLRERVGRFYTEAGEESRTDIIKRLNAAKKEVQALEDVVEAPATDTSEVAKTGEYKNAEGKKVPVYEVTKEQPLTVREREAGIKPAPKEGGIEERQGELFTESLATLRATPANFMRFLKVQRRKLSGESLRIVKEKERLAEIQENFTRLSDLTKDLEQLNLQIENEQVKILPVYQPTEADKKRLPAAAIKAKVAKSKAQQQPHLQEIARLEKEKARVLKQMNALSPEATRPLTQAEIEARKTKSFVDRLTGRLEASFESSKTAAESRSAALRKVFKQPEIDRLTADLKEVQDTLNLYEYKIKLAETHKDFNARTKEAKFVRDKQIPAYRKYIAELQEQVDNMSYWLQSLTSQDTEYFVAANESKDRSVRMTRKLLAQALEKGSITADQNRMASKKVDAADAINTAEIEKRIGDSRKAEQKLAEDLSVLPGTRRELVASRTIAKTDTLKDVNAKIRAAQKEQATFAPSSDEYKALQRDIGVLQERRAPLLQPMQRPRITEIAPQTVEEKRAAQTERAKEEAAERAATRKENEARVAQGLTQPKEETVKANIEAAKGVTKLAAKPPREERKKPLKLGKREEAARGKKAKADLEQEAYDAGVSREDYEFVTKGLEYGFKARAEQAPATKGTVSQDDVKKELAKVKVPKGLKIVVLDKLTGALAEKIQMAGHKTSDVRGGVLPDGTVIIVAENHNDINDVKETIAHELIGHLGVEKLLGESGMKALAKQIQKDENNVFELAKKLGVFDDVLATYANARRTKSEEDSVLDSVRELIAHVEEKRPTQSNASAFKNFIKALVGAVRAGLRKLGLNLNIGTTDIYNILRDARKQFEEGSPGAYVNKDGGIMFRTKPAVANAGFEDVLGFSDKIVAKEKSFIDKIKGEATGLIFKTKYVDRFAPIEAVTKGMKDPLKATQLMYFLRMHDQRMAFTSEVASNGPLDLKPAKDGKGLIIESTPGANLKDMAAALKDADVGNAEATSRIFTMYLAAKRAANPKVGLAKLNFGPEVTQKMLDDTMRAVENSPATKAAFEKAAGIYNEYNKGLINFGVKTGAIPKAIGEELLKNKDYVPFYRQRSDGSVFLDIGGAPSIKIGNLKDQPYLHELVGGDKPIFDVYTSALQNTSMLTDMALRNLATRNTVFALGDIGLLKTSDKKDDKGIRKGDGPAGQTIVHFKIDGENHWAEVNTEAAGIPAELLVKGLEGVNTSLPNIVKMMNVPANLLRKWVTRNPAYALRQVVRDPLNAVMTTGLDTIPIASSIKEIAKMIGGKSEGEPLLQSRGILGGQVLTGTSEDMTKILRDVTAGKKGWEYRMAQLDQLAIQGDAATRVVMYNNFIKQGLSEMEATLATLEAMNFSKRGISPSLFALSTMVPFMNAQIQGLNVLYQAFRGNMPFNEKLKVKQKLLQRGLMMVGFTMLYASMMQDDEGYQNANDDEKYGNWFLPNPFSDEHIRVPIPFEIGFIFKAVPEALVNTMFGDDKARDSMAAIGKMAWNSIPISGPQGIKPLLEVAINHSFYTGRAIESDRLQRFEPGERYDERTSEISKAVGAMFNISPTKIDYLIRGYTGSLPLAVASLANPVLRGSEVGEQPDSRGMLSSDTPLIGTFFQPKDAGGLINKAYKDMNEIVQAKETYNKMVEEGRDQEADAYLDANADMIAMASFAGKFRKKMGDLTKQERAIKADQTMSGAQKRAELDAIRQDKIELAKDLSSARE